MAPSSASSASTALNTIIPLVQIGDAYSAHQKARTFAARYLKAKNYAVAVQVLFESAKELLKAGQQGSGTDLGGYLVDAYEASGEKITEESRGRLTQLIALTGAEGAWRSALITKVIAWSAKASECPAGDPDLQHYLGELFYKEGDFAEAEARLLASGTRDSARTLAQVMFEWSRSGAEPGAYASRGVIPYLLTTNILAARTFLSHFLSLVLAAQPNLLLQQTSVPITPDTPGSEMWVTNNPTLNFLQLAIATCQRADPQANGGAARNAWVRLCSRYAGGVGTTTSAGSRMLIVGGGDMKEAIAALSHVYFNVTPPGSAAANPLQDMMASLFGGGLGGDPQPKARRAIGRGRGRGSASEAATALD
ncbi:hypothetical protein FRC03_000731 [Tulasnella sp. 419]|nr:hypothetical protein FRC03_000731 [Tulasnella sp. 419]